MILSLLRLKSVFLALIVLQCIDHAFLLFANYTTDQIGMIFVVC